MDIGIAAAHHGGHGIDCDLRFLCAGRAIEKRQALAVHGRGQAGEICAVLADVFHI